MSLKPLVMGDLKAAVPVIQGGMGVGVSRSSLAGAVASEGGVGVISTAQIGYDRPGFDQDPLGVNLKAVAEEIRRAKEISGGGVVGVNIMTVTQGYEDYVRAAAEAGADLILSGAGLPVNLPALTAGSGVRIAPIVSSLKSAQVILKYWMKKHGRLPDLVVIEGPLAGGHLGFTTQELKDIEKLDYDQVVRDTVAFIRGWGEEHGGVIPVAVAGGVYTAEDMRHCLELGADAVQVGTRFVTTYECDAHDGYKQAYIDAEQEDIIIVKSPVGMPGRALNNAFIKNPLQGKRGKCHRCISVCRPDSIPYCITDALVNAVRGNVEEGLVFCGANAYRAKKLEHVGDIMAEFKEIGENDH